MADVLIEYRVAADVFGVEYDSPPTTRCVWTCDDADAAERMLAEVEGNYFTRRAWIESREVRQWAAAVPSTDAQAT